MSVQDRINDSTYMTDERFDRLPRWAQDEISQLVHLLDEAREQLAAERGAGDGPTVIDPYSDRHAEPKRYPVRTRVRFELGDGERFDVRLMDEGYIEVNAAIRGFGRMAVIPHASNVVYITQVSR